MHTLPNELAGSIGTSTLFAAWNAAIYVCQIEDERLTQAVRDALPRMKYQPARMGPRPVAQLVEQRFGFRIVPPP